MKTLQSLNINNYSKLPFGLLGKRSETVNAIPLKHISIDTKIINNLAIVAYN